MKVITPKVKERLSSKLVAEIWRMYDEGYSNVNKDDYQFINLISENSKCKIIMKQEEPQVLVSKIIDESIDSDLEIWIIDDGIVQTMLFSDEY
ncbi:DUF960 family protein [Enterococcus faecalis]